MKKADAVELIELAKPTSDLRSEVVDGLSRDQKSLPCKLFYDRRGAGLFEEICTLPEYYPTRTELSILERWAGAMAAEIGSRALVVELGAGAATKIRLLVEELEDPVGYMPIDISTEQLLEAARDFAASYPGIPVVPVSADYTRPLELPEPPRRADRTVAFFPGSTIGNFERHDAVEFLCRIHDLVGDRGGLLVGVDLHKDTEVLERAYNDDRGVTARFNLNILDVVNRECGADFDRREFSHDAVYDSDERRIEMRLISHREQEVAVNDQTVRLRAGEFIVTEYSHKYDLESFSDMADDAGFQVRNIWFDDDRLFSIFYLEASVTR